MLFQIPQDLARRALQTDHLCHTVEEGARGLWILTLWGALPVGWAGNLAQNCAVARMSVRDGEAVCLSSGRWAAAFHLAPDAGTVQARQFDFAAMSLRRPRSFATTALRLDKATVELDPRAGEVLVDVESEDRLGLLGFVLQQFATFYLFPVRLSVRTAAGRVRDRFALTGVGGSPPSARSLYALEKRMGALCGAEKEHRPTPGPAS